MDLKLFEKFAWMDAPNGSPFSIYQSPNGRERSFNESFILIETIETIVFSTTSHWCSPKLPQPWEDDVSFDPKYSRFPICRRTSLPRNREISHHMPMGDLKDWSLSGTFADNVERTEFHWGVPPKELCQWAIIIKQSELDEKQHSRVPR
jgi:hypothetical protein